jgi:hypothetical protein
MGSPKGKQPLRLSGIMFDEDNKLVPFSGGRSGFAVHRIASGSDYYRAQEIEDMDRNMVFMEFTVIRNKGEMIFVTDSVPDITSVLTRAVSEKWVIPTLDFQLGYYPNLRAEVSGKPFYLIDKFNFTNAVMTKIWPGRKIYADDEDISDIVQLKFTGSWIKDYGDTEHPIR